MQDNIRFMKDFMPLSDKELDAVGRVQACAGLFRSMGKTKVLMEVSLAMNAINVIGNAIGVFVLQAGVAYPSLVSRIFAAVAMLFLAVNKTNPLTIQIRQVFAWKPRMIVRIFRIAVPNSVENGLFQIAKVALSSIVAMFGTVQIAANGVAQSFWSMAALFCIAMGPAFITVIGQYIGSRGLGRGRVLYEKNAADYLFGRYPLESAVFPDNAVYSETVQPE